MSGIPSWARVGAKVVCVDASPAPGSVWFSLRPPVVGTIYTVSKSFISPISNEPVVHLAGMPVRPTFRGGYLVSRFRPLITLEDDISTHFAALLDVKQPSPVSA